MTEPVVAHLDDVWSSIEDVCSTLTPDEWHRPTDLPGWSVQDTLSHMCGTESKWLRHRQPAPIEKPWPSHVRNDLAAMNEAQIIERRSLAPEDVLTEFLELTAERLKILSELTPAEWSADAQGPLGVAPLRDVMAIRLLDCFYHEQDIRRAAGRDRTYEAPAARFIFDRISALLPAIVAKRAGVNDGATVTFDVTGPIEAAISVAVDGGRGEIMKPQPKEPTTLMRMDTETFFRAMGGRGTPEDLSKQIIVKGNATFANQILASITITP